MTRSTPTFEEVEHRLVYGCGFAAFRSVDGKTEVTHILPRQVAGIYVLSFKDSSFYVGLAKDLAGRFEQHVGKKRPIRAYTSRKVHKAHLQAAESETIAILQEMGVKLTNTEKLRQEIVVEAKESSLKPKEVEKWLLDDSWNDLSGDIPHAPRPHSDIEERYRNEFLHKPYAQDVIEFFAVYIKKCIIKPLQTAPTKWNITCLPSTAYESGSGARAPSVSVLNVGGQYVAMLLDVGGSVEVSLAAKKSAFYRVHPDGEKGLHRLAPSTKVWKSSLKMLGDDQVDIIVPLDEAVDLLKDKGVVHAIRALVVHDRGMNQSGYSPYWDNHCYSFAEAILARLAK
jgi:predicted GIY-YIG superfamily endonuclease